MITLTTEEAKAIYQTLDMLGADPHNLFSWDGANDQSEPLNMAWAMIFSEAGEEIPENLKEVVSRRRGQIEDGVIVQLVHRNDNAECPWNDPESYANPVLAGLPCSCDVLVPATREDLGL